MRDLIWTLIAVWAVYKLISAFQSIKKNPPYNSVKRENTNTGNTSDSAKRSLENEGDYVDFEEIK